ncbi:MAG: acetyl-CoA carboxylase biotin carboxyl carrier protein subunit [Clostridia bacterium]|nr:acetyl-CoA carboxylase biotin carboxyl carrier protein subunit [Clostridia bacterium]MDH7573247.1 acetyl-CoA carboxylase biotin carboxyl carrier protein subunit [Clostridia bacterium]
MATELVCPMVGKVVSVLVKDGDQVQANQTVVVIEAMKMNVDVVAPASGTIKDIKVKPGDVVDTGMVMAIIE